MVLSPSRQSKQLKKPSKLQCFNDLAWISSQFMY
jgi:hypothetical protein